MSTGPISWKKYIKAIMNLLVALVGCLLVIFLLPKVLSLLAPFIAGGIIAAIASPLVQFLERKLNIKRKAGSIVVIVGVIALVVVIGYFIIVLLGRQLLSFLEDMPAMWDAVSEELRAMEGSLGLLLRKLPGNYQDTFQKAFSQFGDAISNFITAVGSPTMTAVGNVAKQIPNAIVAVVFSVLSAFFFVSDKGTVRELFSKYAPSSLREIYEILRRSLVRGVGGYFKAQLRIEVWVYFLLLLGLLILRVSYAPLIALLIAFLDFLPVFGTGTVMIPWALLELFDKNYYLFAGLLITWAVGQLVRQVIQPKIVADAVDMKPLPTIILLYLGYRFKGVIGMIIAVPVGLVLMTMYEEHAFDTVKDSIRILVAGFNNARRLTPEDMWEAEEVHSKSVQISEQLAAESKAELERLKSEEEAYREERLKKMQKKWLRKGEKERKK